MAEISQIQSVADDALRSEARLRFGRRVHAVVSATYFYEILVLTGFGAAGYVAPWIVSAYALWASLINIGVFFAQRSAWAGRLSDPSMFLVQEFCSTSLAVSLGLVAPQIAIQPLGTMIATIFFGFIVPKREHLYITLSVTLVGVATVLACGGSRITMPTSTIAGQALVWATVLGVLLRAIGVADFVSGLRRRLHEKNDALRVALARIEILAHSDELTGLSNRRSVMQWLGEHLPLCERTRQPVTIALLDIDFFKRINDDFGHHTGDRVLEAFAHCASAALRSTDRLGRFGGEEFILVLVSTSLQEAMEPLERMRARVAACDWSNIDPALRVTVTIGAAAYRHGDTINDLLVRADVALYRGKASGRNCVVLEDQPFPVRMLRNVTSIAFEARNP
jgi:diguanylate cyclase (GGDEF)-like protein